ncbi:hypothetical protein T492DRAFT_945557 [Pavlovales sp. CCMP2436]|nr:hypothetical protein T492DRAFT_945557 [Pavlovales sp. CCMP2436]
MARRAVRAVSPLRSQNLLSCVQTPLPRLTSSTSRACRARRATWGATRRARWSAGHGTDSTARPRHSKREARDHRKATGMSPIEHIEHLEYLEKRWIDLTCASSPLRAHRRACNAVRARREGAPLGGGGGSCSARRTSKVGLGKMDERQARFGAMILEIASDPASRRSDSRALLPRRTVARR